MLSISPQSNKELLTGLMKEPLPFADYVSDGKPVKPNDEAGLEHQQSRGSLCGNVNCPNCCPNLLATSINSDCFNRLNEFYAGDQSSQLMNSQNPAHTHLCHGRSRICSSNDSSQLDESYDYSSRCISPPPPPPPHPVHSHGPPHHLFPRQRARSLSCSPSKLHNESDMVVLQNEKFKGKFPNACKQMEEKLQRFIDSNKDLTQIDYCQADPAAR